MTKWTLLLSLLLVLGCSEMEMEPDSIQPVNTLSPTATPDLVATVDASVRMILADIPTVTPQSTPTPQPTATPQPRQHHNRRRRRCQRLLRQRSLRHRPRLRRSLRPLSNRRLLPNRRWGRSLNERLNRWCASSITNGRLLRGLSTRPQEKRGLASSPMPM